MYFMLIKPRVAWCVSILLLLVLAASVQTVRTPKTTEENIQLAKKELELKLKKINKTKRFMHDLNAHVRRL